MREPVAPEPGERRLPPPDHKKISEIIGGLQKGVALRDLLEMHPTISRATWKAWKLQVMGLTRRVKEAKAFFMVRAQMDVNSKSPQQALKRLLAYKRRQKNLERRLFNNREIASAERVMQELSGVAIAPPTKIRTSDKLVALQTLAKVYSLFREQAPPPMQGGVVVQHGVILIPDNGRDPLLALGGKTTNGYPTHREPGPEQPTAILDFPPRDEDPGGNGAGPADKRDNGADDIDRDLGLS
jgi:hypothetical protein